MNTSNNKPDREFIRASSLASGGLPLSPGAETTWIPWRIDADGEQWYRRMPPMHGVPQTPIQADDDFDEDEDDD